MGMLGILLTSLAVVLAIFQAGKPAKVVRWALVVSGLLQFIAFFMLPGVAASGFPGLCLGVGFVLGLAAGFRTPLVWQGKWGCYRQSFWILGVPLVVILAYQASALLLHAYVPVMLWLVGGVVGLQLGFGTALFFKRSFLKKQPAAVVGLLLAGVLAAGAAFPSGGAYGFAPTRHWEEGDWYIAYERTTSYFFNEEMVEEAVANFPTTTEILAAGGLTIVPGETAESSFELQKGKCLYRFNVKASGSVYAEGSKTYYDAIDGTLEVFYLAPGVSGVMEGGSNFTANLIMHRPVDPADTPTDTPPDTPPEGEDESPGEADEPTGDGGEDAPTALVPLFDDDRGAIGFSGIAIGLSGLISILTGLLPKGVTLQGGAPGSAPPPAVKPGPKAAPPKASKPISQGTPGMRRADGTVYTRNHGWQNEEFPHLQANSLRTSVEQLKQEAERHRQNGDGLRASIAEDLMKEQQRELRRWNEDSAMISRMKSLRNEATQQGQSEKWMARDSALEKAVGYAEKVSFAADIGLAVSTGGVSSVYAGAKSLSTLKNAVKTLKMLSEAKEYVGMAASVADAVGNKKKSFVGAVVEEAINAKVGKVAGDLYGNAFKALGYAKAGKGVDDLTKALVSSGSTYVTGVVQDGAKGAGITGWLPDKIQQGEQNFKKVLDGLSKTQKGGN